ncbi:hypothetical protein Ait01nite_028550 [Actinoplanes italicus]|nr:hypothetical protein Ait01nite_028550 [Actinoplanes italicus]
MSDMTEPPRPPDDDPYNQPPPPPGGYPPPPPPYGAPQYGPGQYGPGQYGPGQYGPGQYGPPPPGYGSGSPDDRTWILIAHFGGALGAFLGGTLMGWIAPLIALVSRGNTSPVVRAEAVKALNFHLLWGIIGLVGSVLICVGIGFFIVGAAWVAATVVGVIAGVKAANNEPFDYPLSYPFLR